MATEKYTAETILRYLTEVADARLRPMMGEYLVYVDDIVVGQINEGELFIKTTPFGEQFAPDLHKRAPYAGAKPAFVVPFERLADTEWLGELISETVQHLPKPRRRAKRV